MVMLTLLGDIGGTNSRFALVGQRQMNYSEERHYENAAFPDFQSVVEVYLKETGARPDTGIVAVAGPVTGDRVGPTNCQAFLFNPASLRAALGFSRFEVINDFQAVARSLPFLDEAHTQLIGPVAVGEPGSNMVVLGPGTGLGVGALVRSAERWIAVPSEGGHSAIAAPSCASWSKVHDRIRESLGQVSGEDVLSGRGLERIDTALNFLAGNHTLHDASWISASAIAGTDRLAAEATQIFFDYLARFSGDVALMFAAKGGVFLYGGVVQKLAGMLDSAAFRSSFEKMMPMQKFLASIPTRLITHHTPGLIGCAAVACDW